MNELAWALNVGVQISFAEDSLVVHLHPSLTAPGPSSFGVPAGVIERKIKLKQGDCVFLWTLRPVPQAGSNLRAVGCEGNMFTLV